MMQRGLRIVAIAWLAALLPAGAALGANEGTSVEVEKPAATPPEPETGYRPPWANPDAKPPEPGIENDPTPFNPADVDANSDTLDMHNVDQ